MRLEATIKLVEACIKAKVTPMLWGQHGIGKSTVVKEIAKNMGFDRVVDIRLGQIEVGDLIGLPVLRFYCPQCGAEYGSNNPGFCIACDDKKVPIVGNTVYLPPFWFPKDGEKVLILFDEINRGRQDVQQAVFQIVLDRMTYAGPLPEETGIVCIGNPQGDERYIGINPMCTALLDRFCNIKFSITLDEWLAWARAHNIRREIIDFHASNKGLYLGHRDDSQEGVEITPSPRSSELLSRITEHLPESYWYDAAVCLLGTKAALAFRESLRESTDKPVQARDIFDAWHKVKKVVTKQSKEGRSELLKPTIDEICECLEKGLGKDWDKNDTRWNNLEEFMSTIMVDLTWDMILRLAKIAYVSRNFLMSRDTLFTMAKNIRDRAKVEEIDE